MSHVAHMNESCHIYGWVMSHIWMSHVTGRVTISWVLPRVMSQSAPTNQSWHDLCNTIQAIAHIKSVIARFFSRLMSHDSSHSTHKSVMVRFCFCFSTHDSVMARFMSQVWHGLWCTAWHNCCSRSSWHDSPVAAARRDMTRPYVWQESFNVWRDSLACCSCSSWHDLSICVTLVIHMCDVTHSLVAAAHRDMTRGRTHLYARRDAFICVMWLIHMCDVTDSYVWRD